MTQPVARKVKPRHRTRPHAKAPVHVVAQASAPKGGKRVAGAIVLAVVVLGFVVWRLRHEPQAANASAVPVTATATPTTIAKHTARPVVPGVSATFLPSPELGTGGVSTDDPLTAYRKANVYPPSSRPLTREHLDLLQPNRRHEQLRATEAGDGTEYLFTADRYFVFGREPLAVTLDVRRDGHTIGFRVVESFVAVVDPANRSPQRLPFEMRPRPDGTYVATVVPSAGLARQTAFGAYVDFQYGDTHQRAHFDFQVTPTAGIPATFTNAFRDGVVAGSLEVRAGVDVARGGHYIIDCNLYDERDEPVAWTHEKVELEPGHREVVLGFFGKVLADQHAHGRFHIGQLRGARFDEGRDPDLEQMPPFAGTYTTKSYASSDFSGADWDSPQKQQTIRFLEEQKARGVHQGAASSADHGAPSDEDK